MAKGKVVLECTLDKEINYHGQEIPIHVCIHNNSNKSVKAIRVSTSFNPNYLSCSVPLGLFNYSCCFIRVLIQTKLAAQHRL